jgi:hypothetical protein
LSTPKRFIDFVHYGAAGIDVLAGNYADSILERMKAGPIREHREIRSASLARSYRSFLANAMMFSM